MVTAAPDWAWTAPHDWVSTWPFGQLQVSRQPLTGVVPVFVTFTSPWNPPGHWPATLYVTRHAPDGCGDEDAERDGETDTDGDGEDEERDGDGEVVPP